MPGLNHPLPRLAVTLGDPAGIGPEVVARALSTDAALEACRPLVVGPRAALEAALGALGRRLALRAVAPGDDPWEGSVPETVPVLDPAPDLPLPPLGAPSAASGALALAALEAAADLARAGAVEGLVTAPVAKAAVRLAGAPGFVGQTEYLAERTGTAEVRMMMAGGGLRVVLVTTHLPLRDVPARIDAEGVYRTLRITHDALAAYEGLSAPHIAVCGLNPHPGEFGEEDEAQIGPAVARAWAEELNVDGPLAADGLFGRVREAGYDAVVAMYHDQGLVPVKLLAPDGAGNVTLGLPFVRTAPGHGTAFEIAGRSKARAGAMEAALALAARWAARTDPSR